MATRFAFALVLAAACGGAASDESPHSAATQPAADGTPSGRPAVAGLTIDTTQWTADVEARAIASSAGRVSRNGPVLELRLSNGTSKTVANETNRDITRFVYLGELDSLPYYVIGMVPPRLPELRMILLDERTGAQTAVPGVPIVSPNQTRFFVLSGEVEAEHPVQIWSITASGPRFEWAPASEGQPIEGQWHDDSTVMYRVDGPTQGSSGNTAWIELPFRHGRWQAPVGLTR
jgi:hypothetical protein